MAACIPKLWGWSELRHLDEFTELHLIRGYKGGESSTHFHRSKSNTFICCTGEIEVLVWNREQDPDVHRLRPMQAVIVPCLVRHRMRFPENTFAVEVYTAIPGHLCDFDDIVRDEAGVVAPGYQRGPLAFDESDTPMERQ